MNHRTFSKVLKITDKAWEEINLICKGQLKHVIIERMPDGSIETGIRCRVKKKKKREKVKK